MEADFALYLADVPIEHLEHFATTFDEVANSWRDRGAEGLAALYDGLALCFREEQVCRQAGLEDGLRAVSVDLGGDSDEHLELALGLIAKQGEDLDPDDLLADLLAAAGAQVVRELAYRRAVAAVEASDTVPQMAKN